MDSGIRITETGTSEVIIKKSRFLGIAANIDSEEEARELLNAIRKEHYSARHVCYAYSIGDNNPSLKFSDDGEPGGTAGRPILDVVTNSGVSNIIIIVVRYFGGVLLGTGGLVRAYTESAQEAVKAAEKTTVWVTETFDITLDYGDFERVKSLIEKIEGASLEVAYTDKVVISATVPEKECDRLKQEIIEVTAGRATI
ncbi:MAG: YigZ family protein [Eubacterium sp.]|nr:YigZ family protein [Eubacterium sp.]